MTQSLLVCEALGLMYGSEFAWGLVLFGLAVGAGIGGWTASRMVRWAGEMNLTNVRFIDYVPKFDAGPSVVRGFECTAFGNPFQDAANSRNYLS